MHVTVEARTPCLLCGFQDRIIMFGSARVNKRSVRVRGPLLGAVGYMNCPECGVDNTSSTMRPRSQYVLVILP